ncbi:MAG: hypothetical protein ACRD4E_12230, partial [Bryobacteraceae bacterium]
MLNPADWALPEYNNSYVLQVLQNSYWEQDTPFVEPHAQTFALQAVGALGANPMEDGVFSNAAPSLLG